MLGYLEGKVLSKSLDQFQVVVRTFRLGFEVTVPRRLFETLAEGQKISLWLHTHVREDILALFGFSSESEKLFFKQLLGVSGLGPKTAMALLSEHPPEKLIQLILAKNIAEIATAPGVGKKIAERIALELGSKVEKWAWLDKVEKSAGKVKVEVTPPRKQLKDDLHSALTNLGYVPSQIKMVVERVLQNDDAEEQGFEKCLRQALREMSSRPLTGERSNA